MASSSDSASARMGASVPQVRAARLDDEGGPTSKRWRGGRADYNWWTVAAAADRGRRGQRPRLQIVAAAKVIR